MPPLYDPKALPDSLEVDYVERPRSLTRWMRRCTWGAGGLALLYVAWILWPSNHAALQAGPVSTPHAMFNQDCGKCHTEALATATRLLPGQAISSVSDSACLQCHAAPHHQKDIHSDGCVNCHKEHRGHVALARPNDRHCTACHANFHDTY